MANKLALVLGQVKTILDQKQVASTHVVYSDPFVVEGGENFSVFLKAEGIKPRIRISLCYNFSEEYPPDSSQWAEVDEEGEEYVLIDNFTQREWTISPLILNYSVWVRLRCEGNAGNYNDTQLTAKVVKQRKEK